MTWLSFGWDYYSSLYLPYPTLTVGSCVLWGVEYRFSVEVQIFCGLNNGPTFPEADSQLLRQTASFSELRGQQYSLHTCLWSVFACTSENIPLWVSKESTGPNPRLIQYCWSPQTRDRDEINAVFLLQKEEKQKHLGIGWISRHSWSWLSLVHERMAVEEALVSGIIDLNIISLPERTTNKE